jgi:hypothetical protein
VSSTPILVSKWDANADWTTKPYYEGTGFDSNEWKKEIVYDFGSERYNSHLQYETLGRIRKLIR